MNGGGTSDEQRAVDDLFNATYEELRRLASGVKRHDAGATLSPTGIVNEAWVKLVKSPAFGSMSRLHFKRVAARAMRQVLVEAARRRQTHKRGGSGAALFITFDESVQEAASSGDELLALDRALEELARIHPRPLLKGYRSTEWYRRSLLGRARNSAI